MNNSNKVDKMRRLLVILLALVSVSVKASLVGFPDEAIQLGYQPNKSMAVWHLFEGEAEEIRQLSFERSTSAQHDTVFSVKFSGKDWFVKIVRVNLGDEEPQHFEYEWQLKMQEDKLALLGKVKGEIIFADKAAFFTVEGNLYYVASYPFVTGKTIGSVVKRYINAKQSTDSATFYKALYRYAQVSALLNFNPDNIPEPGEDILKRPVQIYLEDRNGFNELYDEAQDVLYLIDYPLEHENYQLNITVENYLVKFFGLFIKPVKESVCGTDHGCFPIILETFIKGYSDALPKYGFDFLNRTIRNYFLMLSVKDCNGELDEETSNDSGSNDSGSNDTVHYCEIHKLLNQVTPASE